MIEPTQPGTQGGQDNPYVAKPYQTYEVKSGNPRKAAMEETIQQGETQAEANNMLGGGRRRMRHRRSTVRLHKRKLNRKSRKFRGKRHTKRQSKHRNVKRNRTRTNRRMRFHHRRTPRSRFFYLRGGSDEQDGGEITVPQFSEAGGSKGPNNMSQTSQKGNELRLQVMASRCGDAGSTIPCPQ